MRLIYLAQNELETVTFDTAPHTDLAGAIESFERFLRAAGYVFDGNLDIVYEEKKEDKQYVL